MANLFKKEPNYRGNWIKDFFEEDFFNTIIPSKLLEGFQQMRVDISETEEQYKVEAELPGFKKEEIIVDYQNDMLTIEGQRSIEEEQRAENFMRKERSMSSYHRSFHLPNVQEEQITAKFENGVLTLVLPKDKTNKNRKSIPIQ